MQVPSLAAAADGRFELIDVRTAEEFAAHPLRRGTSPCPTLLAHPELLAPGVPYLLICASGKRSLATARALRKLGLAAHSLAGGLQALE